MDDYSVDELIQSIYDYFRIRVPSVSKKRSKKIKNPLEIEYQLLPPDMIEELKRLRDHKTIPDRYTYVASARASG
ncbi:MAG: hypothetical protein N3A54_05050 [Patescibacteria group bacterium]|nr:hypothetical protein [Patescibacteria group bacterium]